MRIFRILHHVFWRVSAQLRLEVRGRKQNLQSSSTLAQVFRLPQNFVDESDLTNPKENIENCCRNFVEICHIISPKFWQKGTLHVLQLVLARTVPERSRPGTPQPGRRRTRTCRRTSRPVERAGCDSCLGLLSTVQAQGLPRLPPDRLTRSGGRFS